MRSQTYREKASIWH